MAAGAFVPYREGMLRIANSEMDIDANSLKAALLVDSYTPDVGAHNIFSDVSASQTVDADYTAGGVAVTTVTVTEDTGEIMFDCDDISFGTTVTISARYLVIYDDTPVTNKWLIVYCDLNDGGSGNVSSTSSNFRLNIPATGFMRLRQAP